MVDLQKLFESFASLRIGVVGDIMLDTYIWGKVERISPEAPVPVVSFDRKEYRIGGAGNVGINCKSLGSLVSLISVTGDDADWKLLSQLLYSNNIDTSYVIKSPGRITTSKTRIISRNQQMMRLDAETTNDLNTEEEKKLLEKISEFISTADPSIIILQDYNKGVLTEKVINETIRLCKQAGVVVAADPKRKNFFNYRGVDIFKPNLSEVKAGLNLILEGTTIDCLRNIDKELKEILHHKISLITLSDKGIFYADGEKSSIIPAHIRSIADVSGAGDTVIAVASMVYAVTGNCHLMAEVANIAGGLVCEEVGTATISTEVLLRECELLLS